MGETRNLLLRRVALLAVIVAALSLIGALAAACGESSFERALEEAAEQSGQDVDVDVEDGSISVSGDEGDVTWEAGGNLDLPEGFPTSLIPKDAKIESVMTSTEEGTTTQMVAIESDADDEVLYNFFLAALADEGYEITYKMRMEGGEDGTMILINGEKPGEGVAVSGGGETGQTNTYVIQIYPN